MTAPNTVSQPRCSSSASMTGSLRHDAEQEAGTSRFASVRRRSSAARRRGAGLDACVLPQPAAMTSRPAANRFTASMQTTTKSGEAAGAIGHAIWSERSRRPGAGEEDQRQAGHLQPPVLDARNRCGGVCTTRRSRALRPRPRRAPGRCPRGCRRRARGRPRSAPCRERRRRRAAAPRRAGDASSTPDG